MLRAAVVLSTACLIGGCGWTARDEFYRNRSMVLAPQAGDGSQFTASQPLSPLDAPQVAGTNRLPDLNAR
jgi:hypothetical protein